MVQTEVLRGRQLDEEKKRRRERTEEEEVKSKSLVAVSVKLGKEAPRHMTVFVFALFALHCLLRLPLLYNTTSTTSIYIYIYNVLHPL